MSHLERNGRASTPLTSAFSAWTTEEYSTIRSCSEVEAPVCVGKLPLLPRLRCLLTYPHRS